MWYAYGIHFNDGELRRLAKTGTGVAHCPISNMKLSSGVARVPEMLELGVPVGLAVDGSADVLATVGLRGAVDYTVVNGRVVVREGRLATVDEAKTARDARQVCRRYLNGV